MKNLTCLRCHDSMQHLKREKLQLGQTGWVLGDLPNLLSGALEVDIFCCPTCGKIEFFRSGSYTIESPPNPLPQRSCPVCGMQHDFDFPKCPLCGYNYYK